MKPFKISIATCLTVILTLCAASLRAAVINYVGAQMDLGAHWRTNLVQKPLDIDNNNVLGSDGYDVVNIAAVQPIYVSQMTIVGGIDEGEPDYAQIDSPTDLPYEFQTGSIGASAFSHASADLFKFTVNSNAVGRRIRISLLVDNGDYPPYNPDSLTLAQTSGAGAGTAIASVPTTSALFNDLIPDWVFFDIVGPVAGDVYVVRGTGGSEGVVSVGGVAFDSTFRAPLVVTSSSDSGGSGTLRGIISGPLVANDLVQFSTSLSGQTIVLTGVEIKLNQNVTIDASGLPGGIELNGNKKSRIFEVLTNVTATINSLTVTNGFAVAGGGIMNSGTLTLNECSVVGNSVSNGGGGGGIYNNLAMLTLNQCTVASNSATLGSGAGGGIFDLSAGAAVTLNQCTVSGNSAGTGGGMDSFNFIGTNNVIIFNSIVAGNSAPTGSNFDNSTVPFFFGTNLTNGNPFLAPLGNYGGSTPTMLPLPSSPAINAGSAAATNVPYNFYTDQRGSLRAIGTNVDIGADEQGTPPVAIGTTSLVEGFQPGVDSVVLGVPLPFVVFWTATANASWLHLSVANQSGSGSANIAFTFDPNPGKTRVGTLTIAGETVTITQAGSTYSYVTPSATLITGDFVPQGLAVDSSDNIYIADSFNNVIQEWSPTSQALSTVVPSGIGSAYGVALDGSGNIYIADNFGNAVKVWSTNQILTTLIGSGLTAPTDVALDSLGNVYIADNGDDAIKEWVAASKSLKTLVSGNIPQAVALDVAGNVYFSDTLNESVEEWHAANQTVTTVVSFSTPEGVAVDGSGNVYVGATGTATLNEWEDVSNNTITLPPGNVFAQSLAVDASGNLFIGNTGNDTVIELVRAFVDPTPVVESPFAGTDILPPVLPTTATLSGPFAPVSDSPWLTINGAANGGVSFAFDANYSGSTRTAHITLLGQSISVTQPPVVQPVLFGARVLSNSVLSFSITNFPGATFDVLTATNLATPFTNWQNAGSFTTNGSSLFMFSTPLLTNGPQHYFRLRWSGN